MTIPSDEHDITISAVDPDKSVLIPTFEGGSLSNNSSIYWKWTAILQSATKIHLSCSTEDKSYVGFSWTVIEFY